MTKRKKKKKEEEPQHTVLVIDDEEDLLYALEDILEVSGYNVLLATSGEEGLKKLEKNNVDVILCDIKMPGMDGMEILEKVKENYPYVPFVVISGHGNIETAVEFMKKGAYYFIEKPFDNNKLLATISSAIKHKNLKEENIILKERVSYLEEEIEKAKKAKLKLEPILGVSEAIKEVIKQIKIVAEADNINVLILGESGTGKELVARWIHYLSPRKDKPFLPVNCAAIPNELIESVLFGHEKGAFTSAIKSHKGKFEEADGGTLFLDEIGDMSLSAQAKVLRAIQEKTITRIGSNKPIKVDIRLISATNKNLKEEIKKKNFREDLFYRINGVIIHLPPLRERKEDIPILINHYLITRTKERGKKVPKIEKEAMELLKNYKWPGNIRELITAVERMLLFAQDNVITTSIVKKHVITAY